MSEAVALIVNAGGQSRRMGRNKALLPVPPDHVPLVAHVVRQLAPLVTDRIVVVSDDAQVAAALCPLDAVTVMADRWVDTGALGGMATGLAACTAWAMVVACDMPFVSPQIFRQLLEMSQEQPMRDGIIPRAGGQAQPFHSLWHVRALSAIEARLAAGELGVQAALSTLNVLWVDEGELAGGDDLDAFFNVNTPQEWELARTLLAKQNRPDA